MAKQLRKWTPEKVAAVVAYAKTHTHGETLDHFHISSGQLHVWKNNLPSGYYSKRRKAKANGAHRSKAIAPGKPHTNGLDRGALILLEKWRKARLEHIRAGHDTHTYDVYAELALHELQKHS